MKKEGRSGGHGERVSHHHTPVPREERKCCLRCFPFVLSSQLWEKWQLLTFYCETSHVVGVGNNFWKKDPLIFSKEKYQI